MPELPDVEAYLTALRANLVGEKLEQVRLASPFLVRSVEPPLQAACGKVLESVSRVGKRIVFGFEGELFLVLHLMIAGRLRLKPAGASDKPRAVLAVFDFPSGSLVLTEAGTKKRASLYVIQGADGLAAHDPGGLEPLDCELSTFRAALSKTNHTLKRALCDPRILSGVGNAYSDEILHRARLSPYKKTADLDDSGWEALFEATRGVLTEWVERFRAAAEQKFPDKVTAFPEGMAVHGRFGEPCPVCGAPVQRIVFATRHESNYCARCQTGGRLLADRALSRLLKDDWPRRLEELE